MPPWRSDHDSNPSRACLSFAGIDLSCGAGKGPQLDQGDRQGRLAAARFPGRTRLQGSTMDLWRLVSIVRGAPARRLEFQRWQDVETCRKKGAVDPQRFADDA